MSSGCFVTGLRVQFGHSVSKSNIKTKRKLSASLSYKNFYSDTLKKKLNVRVSKRGIRTIRKLGSIDLYVLSKGSRKLTDQALSHKRLVMKVMAKEQQPAQEVTK